MVTTFILEIAVLLAAAIIGGLVVKRLGYPSALGELAVGIAIGPFALGFVRQSEMLVLFAELGAIILLFYIGLQVETQHLRRVLKPSILVGTLGAIVPLALGYYSGLLVGLQEGEALFLGVVLMATSLGITVRMLSDLKKLHTRTGMTIVGAGVVDDVVAIILLTLVIGSLAGQLQLIDVGTLLLTVVGFWVAVLLIGLKLISRLLNRISIGIENELLLVFALGFAAAFISGSLGMSTIIGAFAIGVSLSGFRRIGRVLEKGHGIYLFFVPIFFVSIGMLVNLQLFAAALLPSLLITALAFAGKVGGCGAAAVLTGSSPKDALRIGVGMSPRGEMGLIIAGIGLASGFIGDQVFSLAVVSVALTTLIGMPALKIVLKDA